MMLSKIGESVYCIQNKKEEAVTSSKLFVMLI
ncbi:hypothetical protein PT2222_130301 [Paraburkholderia tropica]